MSVLSYDKSELFEPVYKSKIYSVKSLYAGGEEIHRAFMSLKSNIVDLNPALVTKCIQGTEQDFLMLMNRAKDYLNTIHLLNETSNAVVLDLFKDCVFGYYVLTPLVKSKNVSDIKVLAWNQITCKARRNRLRYCRFRLEKQAKAPTAPALLLYPTTLQISVAGPPGKRNAVRLVLAGSSTAFEAPKVEKSSRLKPASVGKGDTAER